MSLLDHLIVSLMPLVPKPFVRMVSRRYVAGERIEDMLGVVRRFNMEGVLCTVDLLGEFIHHKYQAEAAAEEYKKVLAALAAENLNANISVKLSQMGLLLDQTFCYDLMRDLVSTAKSHGNFVRIDMEDSPVTSDTIGLYLRLRQEFDNVGIVLQAYLRRTMGDARYIIEQGAGHFRLCKGIYIEKRKVAYKDKELVNKNYALVLEDMFRRGAYVGIATHDEKLVWEAQRLIDQYQLRPDQYEFQMLLGVDPELRDIITGGGHRLRVYVPYGQEWYAYSMRRLKENPTIARYVMENMFTSMLGSTRSPNRRSHSALS